MNNLLLYKTLILRSLNTMLAEEGIVMTTAAAVDIEKILAHTDIEKLQQLSELKYLLSPLICRNKEDQDKVYKLFEKLDANFAADYLVAEKPFLLANPATTDQSKRKEVINKLKSPWYLKRVIAPGALILAILLLGYLFRSIIFPPKQFSENSINIVVSPAKFALVNDTVLFTANVDSNLQQQNSIVDWNFPDTIVRNQRTVSRVVKDTAFMLVTAFLKDRNGLKIDSADYNFQPVCEIPPSVTIDEADDYISTGLKAGNSKKKRFSPIFANDTVDPKKYAYKWYVDDSLYSTKEGLNYSKTYNTIKLVVGCNGLHCSTDSMTAKIESVPALTATISGDGNLKIQTSDNWKNMLMSLLLLVFVPSFVSLLIYEIILSAKKYIPSKQPIEAGTEGPYTIKFNDQIHNINTDAGIRKLADILRKRQVSDIYKLSLRKTIRSTVIAGGIPKLEFIPLSKPMNFIAFIDKEKRNSFLVKLFEYLVQKLQKEEVNIVVYEYFKEPLFLSNEKLNQEHIPLEKIAALYPDTTLFIFGEAQYFLYPLKGTVKDWVTRKLNNWPVKILITPFGNVDWDKKEKLLVESNFVVLPADLSSLPVIDKIISGQIDIRDQKKERLEESYRSRFLNLQDFETLKNYLGQGPLLQWVCSLAIYPSADWNLTIAIGKAIEQGLQKNGEQFVLVNYTNLLKIGRISWMQDGIINESLRVQMLTYLGKDAEALAREVLSNELQLIAGDIKDDSLVKANFDLHNKLNRFLLDSYHHRKIDKEDESFIKKSLKQNRFDEGQDIYLDKGNNSMLSHPFKKEQEVGLTSYFKLISNKQIVHAMSFALVAFIALILLSFNLLKNNSSYLNWSEVKLSQQQYELTINANNIDKELKLDLYYEPSHSGSESRNIRLANKRDTFRFNDIMITDTTGFGRLKISTLDGQVITDDSFKLNSAVYNINLYEIAKTPVRIFYKDAAALSVANTIAENLPSNFSASLQQQSFPDTALASVLYFSESNKQNGSMVAGAIRGLFGINVQPKQVDSLTFPQGGAGIVIYVNRSTSPCTSIASTALPQTLNEIWQGGTSNRLININLAKRVMYYSVNDPKNFGTYGIDEICLTKNGAYKITAKTTQGYKLFFIRSIKPQSFELSVCQNFVQSKAELANKDESYCDKFNTMAWYYTTNTSRIFLPVSGATLAASEKRKLDRIADSIRKNRLSSSTIFNASVNFLNQFDKSNIGKILSNSSVDYTVSRSGAPIMENVSIVSPDPFQRNYLVFDIKIKEPEQPPKSPDIPEQNLVMPDCAVTYTSLDEISKLKTPLMVCKLDLSRAGLTSIPKELYSFTNMQQLSLGTTTIPASEIDQLQSVLRKCKISYTAYTAPPLVTEKMHLGNIYFEKGMISSQSRRMLDNIGKFLLGNKNAAIVLEAQYNSTTSQKNLMGYISQVVAYFAKMGVTERSGQITENITGAQQQQIQKKAQKQDKNQELIKIKGVNFPAGFNDANNKSAY